MITIRNTQHSIPINIKKLEKNVASMLATVKYQDFDLGIWLATNATIRRYNKQYRGKDKPTDILSFPYHTELKAGQKIIVKKPDDKNLGDLIISVEYAQKDAAKTWQRSFDEHLLALIAHGIAHCLGYDHETDTDWAAMQKFEKRLLASFS